jgi:hypothetical protein
MKHECAQYSFFADSNEANTDFIIDWVLLIQRRLSLVLDLVLYRKSRFRIKWKVF